MPVSGCQYSTVKVSIYAAPMYYTFIIPEKQLHFTLQHMAFSKNLAGICKDKLKEHSERKSSNQSNVDKIVDSTTVTSTDSA